MRITKKSRLFLIGGLRKYTLLSGYLRYALKLREQIHHGVALVFTATQLLLFLATTASADIRFEDVSLEAGVFTPNSTAAASWGDFNNDGWPDLWVSNHHARAPSLYLNQQDGTFADIASKVLSGDPRADFHGAAWADFDNDGDQDLIVTTGGGAGRGTSPNFVFVNENGKLTNRAKDLGLDYPKGRGRLPVWFDVNQDGKLDVLLVNSRRQEAPTAVFLQTATGSFEIINLPANSPPTVSQEKSFLKRITRLFSSKPSRELKGITVNEEFAQLADLSGNGKLDIAAFLKPMRIFSVESDELHDITNSLELPNTSSIQDAAIEDFNGDGKHDLFLVRGQPWAIDIVQTSASQIRGKLKNKPNQSKTIRFRSSGDLMLGLYRPWMDPTDPAKKINPKLFIGSKQLELAETEYTVSKKDAAVHEAGSSKQDRGEAIAIEFNTKLQEWSLESSVKFLNFTVSSTKPIETLETKGLKPSQGDLDDILLFRKGNTFSVQEKRFTNRSTACASVVAGDFDNDMDIDLYLVCSSPVKNLPNILYENDGTGIFTGVSSAGGAQGSAKGIGNQVTLVDFNRDGFLDLFVTNGAGPPPFAAEGPHQLFRNVGNENNWLQIDLQGVISNKDGIGAKVVMEASGKLQVREQGGGMHSFSQNHPRVHFGLGQNEKADKVEVIWPSGKVQTLRDIRSNQILTIREIEN